MAQTFGTQQLRLISSSRVYGLLAVILALFLILIGRLVQLQVVQHDQFVKKSEGNRLRIVPINAARGNMLDRKGRILAGNRFSYSVMLHPTRLSKESQEATFKRLDAILDLSADDIAAKVKAAGYGSPYPVILQHDADEKMIATLLEQRDELPGIDIGQESVRSYPKNRFGAHTLGYTGEITQDELNRQREKGYRMGDVVGKTGLEKVFDEILRGRDGGNYMEVDSLGRLIRPIKRVTPQQGSDLLLSIDADLQETAEKALAGQKGAVVAIDPRDGQVLVLASKPDFDPNLFATRLPPAEWKKLQASDHPFHSRALNAYPPGSTFKIVTQAAAMQKGLVDERRRFNGSGAFRVGGWTFHNHEGHGYGVVNIVQAMAFSVNTVFYPLGLEMGIDHLAKTAREFHLGQPTGIGLPGEAGGNIPDPDWKKTVYNDRWYAGDTCNTAIGQGYVQLTPLQEATVIATVANGGTVWQPQLVKASRDREGKLTSIFEPRELSKVPLTPQQWRLLRKGLEAVVNSGTGGILRRPDLRVAGKTGTADDPPRKKPNAWMVAYAPADKPTIAICAFVQQGGFGGVAAGGIIKQVLDKAFPPKSQNKGAR